MASWIDGLFQGETIPMLDATMGFAHQKQLAIMNNIANIDNPYYKRQDVPEEEFMGALKDALESRRRENTGRLSLTDTFNVEFGGGSYPSAKRLEGRDWGPERHDENTVVPEKEMADLAKNQLYMSAMQRLYKQKLASYRSALRDKVM